MVKSKFLIIKVVSLSVLFILFSITEALAAVKYTGWQTIIVPGVYSFQIPPTMEIQGEKYKKFSHELKKEIFKKSPELSPFIFDERERVIAQQQGLNNQEGSALKKYARILVSYSVEQNDDTYDYLHKPFPASDNEVVAIGEAWRDTINQTGIITVKKWYPSKKVKINDYHAICHKYIRKSNTPGVTSPVFVVMYNFFNKDMSYTVTISYRHSEEKLWKNDLEKVINTFTFEEWVDETRW